MVWVDPGIFTMGSAETETGRDSDEGQFEVTLSKGFWLGRYEVTQAQWNEVMGTTPGYFTGDGLPVEQVSWEDAMAFCAELQVREFAAGRLPAGYVCSLPTEAQWEYACRAGTTTATSFGDLITAAQANFDGSIGATSVVGSYPANPWGFHDMHGNVWEWCSDWYGAYPSGIVTDPTGAPSSNNISLRGGSWSGDGQSIRSANRHFALPSFTHNSIGFRVCLPRIPLHRS
jgi:sulfatase modifying factor 1